MKCSSCLVRTPNPGRGWCQQCFVSGGNGSNLCSNCNQRPPNPGHGWCQQCFVSGGSSGVSNLCSNCNQRPPNPGHGWCQQCFLSGGSGNSGVNGHLCPNCHQRPPNPGYSWCQQCFVIGGSGNSGVNSQLCPNCHQRPPNPEYSWCQQCFISGGSGNSGVNSHLCSKCHQRPPNPGYKMCQQCFVSVGSGGKLCANCHKRPPNPGYGWCQQCFAPGTSGPNSGANPGQRMLRPVDAAKYNSVKNQFSVGISKKGGNYTILNIYSVWDVNRHSAYQSYKSNISSKNGGDANEKRWWHGSHLKCDLMNTMNVCSNTKCSICGILKKGFLLQTAGKNFGWTRFGPGLYFAPDAAKSNDYATPHNGIKCMILCRVVVGKPKIFYVDQTHLKSVPVGFDSILGEVGTTLNFPELVLYDEDAVLPSYVVFYQ